MKKTIISIATAVICVTALSTQAFAAKISDTAIFAADMEQIAKANIGLEWEGEMLTADASTAIPLYEADIYDYARTGNFDVKPTVVGKDKQLYIADAVNENGDFAGKMTFTYSDAGYRFGGYSPSSDKADSIALASDAKRINAVMSKRYTDFDCKEIKLIHVDHIGYVYYINTGTSKFLSATGFREVNREVLNKVNGGIIEIGDDLKAFANRKLAEMEEIQKTLAPGENPPEGGYETPSFRVDNTPYLDSPGSDNNPNTGSNTTKQAAALAIGLAALSVSAVGGKAVSRKRKNDR